MTVYDSFDLVDSKQLEGESKPYWTLDEKKEDEIRGWILQNWDALLTDDEDRLQIVMANMAAYRGIHYKAQDAKTRELNDRTSTPILRQPRVVVNHIHDLIEQQVSRTTKFKPAITGVPATDQHEDVITAQIAEKLVKARWYDCDMDYKFQRLQRQNRIIGEGFLFPFWDMNKGALDDDYKKEMAKAEKTGNGKIPLLDPDSGEQREDSYGNKLFVNEEIREGDVSYKFIYSWAIQFQPVPDYDESEWAMVYETAHVEDLRKDHPSVAADIKAESTDRALFDPETFQKKASHDVVEVIYFIHKSTKRVPGGRIVKVCRSITLEEPKKLPAEYYGEFPWVRLTDVDYPHLLRGYSLMEHGRQLQGLYNNLTSLLVKNLFWTCHPKWMVARNSCKLANLGNDATVVQYTGPTAPRLETPQGVTAALFSSRSETKDDLQQIMAVGGVARGEPPPGVKAGVAIQYLDEKDLERQNSAILKHNKAIREVAVKTLRIMATRYKGDSKRLERMLGSQFGDLKKFDVERIADIRDVKVQTTSALPETKAARIQTVINLNEAFPNLMPPEYVVDVLEFGQDEKFHKDTTVAVRSSEAENDKLIREGKMDSPEPYEIHAIHYKLHVKAINDPAFKPSAGPGAVKAMIEHIKATELLMLLQAKKNQFYLQYIIQQFPYFPIYQDPMEFGIPMGIQPPQPGMPTEEGGPAVSPEGQMPGSVDQMNMMPGASQQPPPPDAMNAMPLPQGVPPGPGQ